MAFNPPLGSTNADVFMGNVQRLDELINGPAADVPDRAGDPLYSWRLIRQSLIPLSRQYMTLADAQADIANIPAGSAVYVRSVDGSALADEYINNAGTLTPTGRQMPSQRTVDAIMPELINPGVNLFNKNTVTPGYYLFEGSGVPTANPDYCYSERIGIVGDAPYPKWITTVYPSKCHRSHLQSFSWPSKQDAPQPFLQYCRHWSGSSAARHPDSHG